MKKIWKYQIKNNMVFHKMPKDSNIIHLGIQDNVVTMWVMFDVENENQTVNRKFLIVGTGFEFDDSLIYIGTFQDPPYVWHLFEAVK